MKNVEVNEEWRAINEEGYEGLYEVSNQGRIRNRTTGRIMKLYHNGKGYLKVDLCCLGKVKKFYVHRLVAKAFIENPEGYEIINHKDENPMNNNVSNLEWCTYEYNLNYGTAQERKTVTRLMDSSLKDRRENLIKEINDLKLKRLNKTNFDETKKQELEKLEEALLKLDSKLDAVLSEVKKIK